MDSDEDYDVHRREAKANRQEVMIGLMMIQAGSERDYVLSQPDEKQYSSDLCDWLHELNDWLQQW